jgi:ribosome-associated protein YbcJ (S4-like RNA binding protein)
VGTGIVAEPPAAPQTPSAVQPRMVMVNGQTELRRRNKIYPGMLVKFGKQQTTIEAADTE